MKTNNSKLVHGYIREINKKLTCSKDVKKALLHEIEQQVVELENRIHVLTIDDLYDEIGSPQEIALGFDSRSDIEKIKQNAVKYKKAKLICILCSLMAVIVGVFAIVIMLSNDDYSSTTQINSTIEEVTS